MDVNFRTLDLNLLRVFDEVMAERNLTRAARNLSITQPAVSNALRRLREVLGDELVRRSGAGVEPTPRALALWPTVRDALRQLQHTLAPGEFDAGVADTTFLLAMADATAAELVPGLVQIAEKEAPAISLRVLPLTTRDPRRMLELEEVDVAVGYFPAVIASLAARGQSGVGVAFETQRLYLGQYVCVMRRGHPLANAPLTLDDYCAARHLLVSFSGRPYGFIDQTLGALGLPIVGAPGYEADDIIGTLAARAQTPVDVVTGDRDLFQLVEDARGVRVVYTARGMSNLEDVTDAVIGERYGIRADQYADFATLRGDPSDGLPGVSGIGEKSAAALLRTYGSLDAVMAAAADGDPGMTPRVRAKIGEAHDYLTVAPTVVRVAVDAPIAVASTRLPEVDAATRACGAELADRLGLGASMTRILEAMSGAPSA